MKQARRPLYIHIGLHKTGSTTIQHFLKRNEKVLKSKGVFIPRSCRQRQKGENGSIIHSNLSWDLLQSVNFDPALGTIKDMRDELNTLGDKVKRVVITDEGLSRLKHPEVLLELFPDFKPVIVAFQRNPYSAAPSLYTEYLKFGETRPFSAWLATIGKNMLNHESILARWRKHALVRSMTLEQLAQSDHDIFSAFVEMIRVSWTTSFQSVVDSNSRMTTAEAISLFYCNNMLSNGNISNSSKNRKAINKRVRNAVKNHFSEKTPPYFLTDKEISLVKKYFPDADAAAIRKSAGECIEIDIDAIENIVNAEMEIASSSEGRNILASFEPEVRVRSKA